MNKKFLPNKNQYFRIAALMLISSLLAVACTDKQYSPQKHEDARKAWESFVNHTLATVDSPFLISTSIRYATENEKTRVSALIWGNRFEEQFSPIRLDLLAGFGNVVAKVREDEEIFVAFNPKTEVAYFHEHEYGTLDSFGVPIPLSLKELALFLTGQGGSLFLQADAAEKFPEMPEYKFTKKGVEFIISNGKLEGKLELSVFGVPLSWRESTSGWVMELTPSAPQSFIPKQIYIYNTKLSKKNYNATLTVKEVKNLSQDYTQEQLELILPATTVFHKLQSK